MKFECKECDGVVCSVETMAGILQPYMCNSSKYKTVNWEEIPLTFEEWFAENIGDNLYTKNIKSVMKLAFNREVKK